MQPHETNRGQVLAHLKKCGLDENAYIGFDGMCTLWKVAKAQSDAEIAKRDTIIARQAEALESAKNGLKWWCEEYPDVTSGCDYEMRVQIETALSASAESVAAWEAEKLLPLQRQVAMLHDAVEKVAGEMTVGQRYSDYGVSVLDAVEATQATAEAYDREHAAKVLEDAAEHFGIANIVRAIETELKRKASELRAQSERKRG